MKEPTGYVRDFNYINGARGPSKEIQRDRTALISLRFPNSPGEHTFISKCAIAVNRNPHVRSRPHNWFKRGTDRAGRRQAAAEGSKGRNSTWNSSR